MKKYKNIHDARWEMQYAELKKFKKIYGHCNVSRSNKPYARLFEWVKWQKRQMRNKPNEYESEKAALLDKIGFRWATPLLIPAPEPEKEWMKHYNELKNYIQKHKGISGLRHANPALADWYNVQKMLERNNNKTLTEKRIKLLNELKFLQNGISKGAYTEDWMKQYTALKKYIQKHKDISRLRHANPALATWCIVQRQYRRGNIKALTKERIKLLNKLNFPWSAVSNIGHIQKEKWMKHYNKLKEFMQQHKNLSKLYKVNPKLATWCIVQRQYRRGNIKALTKERIGLLNEINFPWSGASKDESQEKWMKQYTELKKYMQQHTDVSELPRVNHALATWCNIQRQYRRSNIKTLTKERIGLLNELNFPWSAVSNIGHIQKEKWMKRYNELKEFMQQHKNLNGLKSVNPALATWCNRQRQYKRKNIHFLTEERIKLLNEINFPWSAVSNIGPVQNEKWMQQYNELKKYMQQHKDLNGLKSANPKLARWCNIQRQYRKGNIKALTEERIKLLNEINFPWSGTSKDKFEEKWMKRYNELKKYMQQHKSISSLPRVNQTLANWCSVQRQYRRNNIKSLTEERTQLLNELNFPWSGASKGKFEEKWMEQYTALKNYIQKHKSIIGLRRVNAELAAWYNVQRMLERNNNKTLTSERIKLLNELKFSKSGISKVRRPEKWINRYNELKEYMQQHKDLSKLYKVNPILANWCNIQKQYRRKNIKSLTSERIKLLNEINFPWNNPVKTALEEHWMKRYNELKEFVRLHKRFPALHDDKKYHYLYIWVRENKTNYYLKASYMTPKRIKLLNDLKIDWE